MLGYTNMEKYHMEMKYLADIILVYKCSCLLGVMQIGKCILFCLTFGYRYIREPTLHLPSVTQRMHYKRKPYWYGKLNQCNIFTLGVDCYLMYYNLAMIKRTRVL